MLLAKNFDNKIKEIWPENGPTVQKVEKYVQKNSFLLGFHFICTFGSI